MTQDAQKKTLITFYNLLQANGWINYSFSIFAASQSFLGPVLILESRLAAFTKKIKPTKPDIPKIAANGSKENENVDNNENIKLIKPE